MNINLSYKQFSILFIIGSLIFLFFVIFPLNYFTDVYGLRGYKNKRLEYLRSEETFIFKARLEAKAPYYLIGTSRTGYIDYIKLSRILNANVLRLGMSSSSSDEWLYLMKKVKENGSSFILGLDTFSFNKNGYAKVNNNRLQKAFKDSPKILDLKPSVALTSLKAQIKNMLNFPYNKMFLEYDNTTFTCGSYSELYESYSKNKLHYKDYEIDFSIVDEMLKYIDSNDIIIIFPKYAAYYKIFENYHNVEEQYFRVIKMIVKNTNAKVYSFYGINDITLNKDNFDTDGWHFKPKIGGLIISSVFEGKNVCKDCGILLTKDNVDLVLNELHQKVEKYEFD